MPDKTTLTNVLELEHLSVSYRSRTGDVPAVVGLSLRVQAGESVGLVGESGCGKSTVALAIMQYLGPHGIIQQGRILFHGRDLRQLRPQDLCAVRGKDLAMVYQEPTAALNPSLTIGTQLLEVLRTHLAMARQEALPVVRQMLTAVRLADVERLLAAYPHQLSGGQQQRVVLAMALLARPALLLLDEPTTALDVTIEAGLIKLIGELRQQFGTSMLFISHNLGLIRAVCDRVYVMYAGEIVEEGPVPQVFRAMRHPYTRGLFAALPRLDAGHRSQALRGIPGQLPSAWERPAGCTFGPRCAHFRPMVCDLQPLPMSDSSAAHRVRCPRWQEIRWSAEPTSPAPADTSPPRGAPLLQIDGLCKDYPLPRRRLIDYWPGRPRTAVHANHHISFAIQAAESVALVGESGSGKSTLARILLGLETATAGRVLLAGSDLARQPARQRTAAQQRAIQMVFQHPYDTLNPSLTIGRQLVRALKKSSAERRTLRAQALRLLEQVQLSPDLATRRPSQLSGGQLQRASIARAFAAAPDLVVADEPVSALDVSVQAAVLNLLLDRQREQHTALLLISHDLAVVRYVADRVVVLYRGQVMEYGSTDEVFAPPYHPYTEALLAAVPLATPGFHRIPLVLEGPVPSAMTLPRGCPFVTRCPRQLGPICAEQPPPLQENVPGHGIACHIPLATLRDLPPVLRPPPPMALS